MDIDKINRILAMLGFPLITSLDDPIIEIALEFFKEFYNIQVDISNPGSETVVALMIAAVLDMFKPHDYDTLKNKRLYELTLSFKDYIHRPWYDWLLKYIPDLEDPNGEAWASYPGVRRCKPPLKKNPIFLNTSVPEVPEVPDPPINPNKEGSK